VAVASISAATGATRSRANARARATKAASAPEHRHEVRVAVPSRHDVEVEMVEDAGAGRFAEIQPEVEPVRLVDGGEGAFHALRERHHLAQFLRLERAEFAGVAVRYDHDVPVVVGEFVENDERTPSPVDDERMAVNVRERVAEDAPGVRPGRRGHVGQPPGREQPIHARTMCSGTSHVVGLRLPVGLVDQVFQFLAGLEVGDALRRHVHLVAGFRIPSLAGLTAPEPEAAKPPKLDLVAAMERVHDGLEHGVDDDLGVLLRQVGDPGDFLDEFGFCHT
jgi:hypothetical protein